MDSDELLDVLHVPPREAHLASPLKVALGADRVEVVALRVESGHDRHVLDRANVHEKPEDPGRFIGRTENLWRHRQYLLPAQQQLLVGFGIRPNPGKPAPGAAVQQLQVRRRLHDGEVAGRDVRRHLHGGFYGRADRLELLRREHVRPGQVLALRVAQERIGVRPDGQLGDEPEELARAADPPQQLRVARFGDLDQLAAGADELRGDDVLATVADEGGVDADAAAEVERDNADCVPVPDR